jgi:hypothetical protein
VNLRAPCRLRSSSIARPHPNPQIGGHARIGGEQGGERLRVGATIGPSEELVPPRMADPYSAGVLIVARRNPPRVPSLLSWTTSKT